MKAKTYKRLRAAFAVLLAFLLFFFFAFGFLFVSGLFVDSSAHTIPSYEREDLSELLLKDTFTEEDYRTLYLQTGLSETGVNAVLAASRSRAEFASDMQSFQDALYKDGTIAHEQIGAFSYRDLLSDENGTAVAPMVPLEVGDILVSSACHTFGWRNGHSALVTYVSSDAVNAAAHVLESTEPGQDSQVTYLLGARWFRESANFIVLRLKEEYRASVDPQEVAEAALETLLGIPYSLTVGIFSKKDQGTSPQQTHCSHLVWQAYKNFGIDLDSDGGPVVTTRDIANSEYLEVIQVYGFDPLTLW